MITVSHLSKSYGTVEACADITFEVHPGAVTALLGPNGAGKSTILKILSGVLLPSAGTVNICGRDTELYPDETKALTGSLFEDVPLYAGLTVLEQLRFMAEMHGLSRSAARETVERLVDTCSLQAVADRLAGSLSRGYRQRAGLAMALVHDPQVLVLDEPTSGLDPLQTDEFRSLVLALAPNKTILLSTHIMQEVESLCTQVVMIDRGALIETGSIAEICGRTGTSSMEKAFLALVKGRNREKAK